MGKKKKFSGWFGAFGDKVLSLKPRQGRAGRIRVAFNIYPKRGPFGGAQEFLKQVASYLVWNGCEVVHELDPQVTHIVILEPRTIETSTFSLVEIAAFKAKFPEVKVIHRVNNCDKKYAADDHAALLDEVMMQGCEVADHVVFLTEWLRDYFIGKGFDAGRPHSVVRNAANSLIFSPRETEWDNQEPLRVVTHHWSDNWLKGFREYQEFDELIASGELEGFEFTVIGRWPDEIEWKSTRTIGPLTDEGLAAELRNHHLYFTASRWEPGGMHFLEGMQCGLPVVYHEDGGGIVEVACQAGVGFREDLKSAMLQAKGQYADLKQKLDEHTPSGDRLCREFCSLILPES